MRVGEDAGLQAARQPEAILEANLPARVEAEQVAGQLKTERSRVAAEEEYAGDFEAAVIAFLIGASLLTIGFGYWTLRRVWHERDPGEGLLQVSRARRNDEVAGQGARPPQGARAPAQNFAPRMARGLRGELRAVHIRAGRRKGLRIELPAPQEGLF